MTQAAATIALFLQLIGHLAGCGRLRARSWLLSWRLKLRSSLQFFEFVVDGQGRQLLAVDHLVVAVASGAGPANVHLAVSSAALAVLAAHVTRAALLPHHQAADAGSRIGQEAILLHLHAAVVRLHVAILDA